MDTVHAVTKRIEQALAQLERELKRNGQELPIETFTVTTGNGITVEAASRPAPLPVDPSFIIMPAMVGMSDDEKQKLIADAHELVKPTRNKKSEPSDDATPPA